jgi:hydrogenase maturation factor
MAMLRLIDAELVSPFAVFVSVEVSGAASVRTAGGIERIDVNLVGLVGPGDLVLVHAGTAVALVELDTG